jgi:pyruvate/2-oxoglutarate dehydrogenase complex dihydrolipoamide dehydrogenase (E3) component
MCPAAHVPQAAEPRFHASVQSMTPIPYQSQEQLCVEVNGKQLTAPRTFINVGGRAVVRDMPGAQDVTVLTNTDMVALDELPRHLVVIGGSYIGLELRRCAAASARK